jgi:hypothetical protein
MRKMKPITKLLLLCATLATLFISTFFLIDKTFKKIKICSDNIAIYNDSILNIKEEFNKYLIYDNININTLDKKNYINNSNKRLNSLNDYIKSDEIKKLAKKKESYIKTLVIKNYKVKESYGVIKYNVQKGWFFKRNSIEKITYKKIYNKEIYNLNKIELLNKNTIYRYQTHKNEINVKLNEIVINKINNLQLEKDNLLESNELETKNTFYIILIINLVSISIIASLSLSTIKDIKLIMRKNNLNKVTLSFLVDYIKNK